MFEFPCLSEVRQKSKKWKEKKTTEPKSFDFQCADRLLYFAWLIAEQEKKRTYTHTHSSLAIKYHIQMHTLHTHITREQHSYTYAVATVLMVFAIKQPTEAHATTLPTNQRWSMLLLFLFLSLSAPLRSLFMRFGKSKCNMVYDNIRHKLQRTNFKMNVLVQPINRRKHAFFGIRVQDIKENALMIPLKNNDLIANDWANRQ